ncbi:D-sedoheptulose 7-phosphate isomerase [Candidatus Pseudothioglobus singularis]|jgi:D-sedoheptulose 7-phosphate isomerase|nr:D-sedoheptulose 7-phosphate isomerase [Candidatus Pseudothioglobus singularis]
MKELINNEFNAHIKTANLLHNLTDVVAESAKICIDCLKNGGKILLIGNGGSAADAQHIAAELVGRYKTERKGIPAIALTTDSSILTSIGNDFGYEHIFDRQIEAIAQKNDVLIGISTSGRSKNIISALKTASLLKCLTIGFSGNGGGEMNNICDLNIVIPSEDTARIQEMHIIIGHTISHLIDQEFSN